ncbi:SMP-30/gluconolactonase/LRE family protein [Psychrosphaera sp. 1_MG-2023]|uniref:SMP-30/gluconolactonase/LRE family protein n=1 Tax=Psychrosphaera sp. 1_MG-2023 TaxID=3062643 RepID=UPI0026E31907|nr:SMP-30/gluconolactonase/LRE family protein [Psychrosphaera sp. 1_MG-2023]MDO6719461.1 SMP-30/gluconolactonase/LRE family protein [Psychrosphaera sp. 1_MG-2023]
MRKALQKNLATVALFLTFCQAAMAHPTMVAKNCDGDGQSPIPHGSKVELISDDFLFLEGPTWSTTSQAFYFSEMNFSSSQAQGPDSTIYKLVLPNSVSTYLTHSGTNGLYAKGANLYNLNHNSQSVSKLNIKHKLNNIIAGQFNQLNFNSPNDMTMDSRGNIYFTDPNWQLGDRTQQQPYTGVYKIDVNGKVSLIDGSLDKPNGVALSPDQKTLYIGDFSNRVSKYDISSSGDVSNRRDFIKVASPDGIKVDCAGNLYVSSHNKGVINIYSPTGKFIDKIVLGQNVTNLAFGGKNNKTILITTAKGLFSMQVNIAGLRN